MIFQHIVHRLQLLGIELAPSCFLLADVLILLHISAFVVMVLLKMQQKRPAELFMAAGLVFLSCIVMTVTLLGSISLLSRNNLVLFHLLIGLCLPAISCGKNWRQGFQESWQSFKHLIVTLLRPIGGLFKLRNWERGTILDQTLITMICAMLLGFMILAVFTLPLNADSNTYRLSRIGYWLQEGSIQHFVTTDRRMNYIAHNADLVMLWITCFFRKGFPLVHLVQFLGGLLSCGAVYEISRVLGFSRRRGLIATVIFLGIPNVALQFFTSQTDLFTTGCLAAGLSFSFMALQEHRWQDWGLFGIGLGLAVGAKGTVFYWGPGLLFLFICWALIQRTPITQVIRGGVLAVGVALLLGSFNYAQNLLSYGNPFAPTVLVDKFHPTMTTSRWHYALLNGVTYLWQVFEPNSNIPVIRPLSNFVFDRLQAFLLGLESPHLGAFPENFRAAVPSIRSFGLHEDFAAFGLPVLLLATIGGLSSLVSITSGRRENAPIAAMFVSVLLFFIAFCSIQLWSPYKFRYFVLLGPFLAILAVSGIKPLKGVWRQTLLILFLAGQFFMAGYVAIHSRSHGLSAMLHPESVPNYFHRKECLSLMDKLGDRPLDIVIALEPNSWLAPFFRTGVDHHFSFEPARKFQEYDNVQALLLAHKADYVITDPKIVKNHPGKVVSTTSTHSRLVAFRLLAAGEASTSTIVLMQGIFQDGWTASNTSFYIENWSDGHFSLDIINPTPLERQVVVKSSAEAKHLTLLPGGEVRGLSIGVEPEDIVTIEVAPAFVPSENIPGSPDKRALGVQTRILEKTSATSGENP